VYKSQRDKGEAANQINAGNTLPFGETATHPTTARSILTVSSSPIDILDSSTPCPQQTFLFSSYPSNVALVF